jgi:hypothetical protein
MIIVYISGPITGKRNNNERAFTRAFAKIIDMCPGVAIINPQDIAKEIDGEFDKINENLFKKIKPQWKNYMKRCIPRLCNASFVYFLEGWEKSKGATLERHVAESLEIPCFETIGELARAIKDNEKWLSTKNI